MKIIDTIPNSCWNCGAPFGAAADVLDEGQSPTPGDFSVCLKCAAIGVFEDDLSVRQPELSELGAALRAERVSEYVTLVTMMQMVRKQDEGRSA